VVEPFKYETKLKEHVLCVDTLGLDCEVTSCILNYIEKKCEFFREQWEKKEFDMLLADILLFLEEEPSN
jgi:hypothetical protein